MNKMPLLTFSGKKNNHDEDNNIGENSGLQV